MRKRCVLCWPFNYFYLYYANASFTGIDVCFHAVCLLFLSGPGHVAESTEGMCPVHLAAYCARVRVELTICCGSRKVQVNHEDVALWGTLTPFAFSCRSRSRDRRRRRSRSASRERRRTRSRSRERRRRHRSRSNSPSRSRGHRHSHEQSSRHKWVPQLLHKIQGSCSSFRFLQFPSSCSCCSDNSDSWINECCRK